MPARVRAVPFPVDHTFRPLQDGPQLGSMIHFRAIFDLVIDTLKPATICEIGIQSGVVTRHLIARAKALGGRYIGIDPVIEDAVRAALGEGDGVVLHASRSLDVLPLIELPDLTVIDGDHNYHTVRGELAALVQSWERAGKPPFAVLLHDTSWPHARRDAYYDLASIPPGDRQGLARGGGYSIRSERLLARGFGARGDFTIAEHWGGARNGVLTAIEDVLRGRDDLSVIHVPAAFGLSLIFPSDARPAPFAAAMVQLRGGLEVLGELIASLEYARLLAYDMYLKDEHARIFKRLGRWLAAPVKAARRRRAPAQAASAAGSRTRFIAS